MDGWVDGGGLGGGDDSAAELGRRKGSSSSRGDAVPLRTLNGAGGVDGYGSVHGNGNGNGNGKKTETWTPSVGGGGGGGGRWTKVGKPSFVSGRLGWMTI